MPPRDLPRSINPLPLSEMEQITLRRLLDRQGQSLEEAEVARTKERNLRAPAAREV